MAIKPKVEASQLDLYRGTGELGSELDYLKVDPTTYFYKKFKSGQYGSFLRDDMWTEANLRGETNVYANILSGIEKAETIDRSFLDKYEFYENQGYGDYDTYMLALSLPTLDDTKKEDKLSSITGESMGSYTNKEWAEAVLTSTFQRYDAEIIEAEKASKNWWERMWTEIGTQTAGGLLNIVGGVSNWVNDIYNIGQGLLNMCFNWSEDASAGDRFLWAFANDEDDSNISNQLSRFTEELTYRMNYEYSKTVNAVEAYEHGYIPPSWGEMWGTGWKTEGEKVYNGFGRMWNGITTSIGYMLPSILLAVATGGASTATWIPKTVGSVSMYTGIASGNIKDTVQRASLNGVSYRDLNAGSVISNAALKATAQWAVEVALGKILGFFSISDKLRGLGDDTVSAATRIGATEGKAFLTVASRGLKSMAKEGLEESLQDLSDGLIDSVYGIGGSKLDQVYRERGVETMDIENLVQTFIAGALTEGIVGSVHSVKFLGAKNRFIGEDNKGNAYKMGMFQSMNFAQSLAALNQWNDQLNNAEISKEEKAEAAYKISTVINTIGEVLHSFGQLDAIKANNLLLARTELSAKHEAKLKLSDTEYAKDLYNTFVKSYSEVVSKYNKATQDSQKEGLFEKVKKFFNKNAKELKESGTTEINNVITEKLDINSPDLAMNKDTASKLKGILKDLGAVALIGVDGNIVTKSEDIIAINNDILESGDIAEIVRDIAYQQVRDTVKTKLSQTQKKRILNTYRKLVGTEATLEEAVTALLFDKNFYTKVLLMTEEKTRTDKLEAVKMLVTIDNLIKTKSADLLKNGSLTDSAYKTLLKKVYETMRTGLIVYATHYTRLDLGSISNDILSSDIKQEITNHRNVIFSTKMDKGINGEILNDQDLTDFDNYVDKFNTQFNAEEIANLKRKARSTNSNDRRDAYRTLILAAKANNYKSVNDKIVYIPVSSDGIIDEENIRAFEEFVGVQFKQLIDGTYDANDLTHHAKNMICPGYDKGQTAYRYNMDDKDARINFARELLFTISKSLTVGADGTILKVIEKDDFIKDEYLGKEGDTEFKQDLQKGKITKISDVSKIKLPKALGDVKVIYDPQLGSINGHFDESVNAIRANYTINTISMMHEITHATQYYTQAGADSTLGGKVEMFENLPQNVLTDLDKYIADTMPMSYTFLSNNKHLKTPDIIYFLLEGELQANATLTSHMADIGFKWKNNKSELVSPDGKKTWSMKASQSKLLKARQQEFKQQIKETTAAMAEEMKPKKKASKAEGQVSEDRILGTLEEAALMQNPEIKEFTKNAYLKKDGNPIIFYRGSTRGHELTSPSQGLFMSTKEYIGTDYAESKISENKIPSLKAYVTNFTKDEVLEIDNKGDIWNRITLDDNLKELTQITNRPSISTDILVDQIFRLHPEIKAIWLRNVVEDPEERGKTGDDLIVNKKHIDGIKSIGIPDQNTFVYAWNRYYNLNKDSLGDYTTGKVKEDLYTKFSKIFKQAVDSNDFTKLEKTLKTEPGAFDYMKKSISEDRPMTALDYISMSRNSEILNFTKNAYLKDKHGIPIVYYRGAVLGHELDTDKSGLFMSTKPAVSVDYADTRYKNVPGNFQGFVTNFTKDEIFELDAKESPYEYVPLNEKDKAYLNWKESTINTNTLVEQVFTLHPEIKAILIKNVLEHSEEDYAGDDLIVNKSFKNHIKKITINDNGLFLKAWQKFEEDYLDEYDSKDDGYNHFERIFNKAIISNDFSELESFLDLPIGYFNSSFSEDKPLTPEEKEKEKQREYYRARHISNKVAQESNLRYWIKKGVPIQINPGIAQFVVNTTNDFENLPKVLQDKIKNATLTKFDIIDYISTHTNIKNFTFKAIAKYVYNSPELAKISYSEMTDLIDNIDIIVAAASMPNGLNPDKVLSPKEMIAQAKEIAQNAEATPETARQYRKALNYAEIMKVGTRKDGSPIFTDVTADPKQMNIMFFNHYDGTPNSLKSINALGKNLALKQQEEGYDDNGVRKTSSSTWNYTAKKREATEDEGDIYDYKDSTLGKALDEIDKVDKINTIAEYIQNTIAERIRKEMDLGKVDMDYVRAMTKKIDTLVNSLHDLSEDELNAKYLEATESEMKKEHKLEPITEGLSKVDISSQPSSISNIKNGIRNAGTSITKLLNRLPDSYDKLPDNIKLAFDEKTLKLKLDSYSKLSRDELIKFKNDLLNVKADLSAQSKEISKAVETKQTLEKKVERLRKQNERLKAEIENQKRMKEEARTDKQTLREKLNSGIKYRTTIRQQEFNFTNNTEPTKLVTNLLNTSWTKTRMSTVQGVVSNKEEIVANGKKFFEENAVALLSSDLAEIEQTVDWFINAKMNEATDTDYKKFVAVKGYFLAWVLSQTRPGEAFANMNSNLKQKIDSAIREMGSTSGTLLAILNNMKEYINPMMAMASADIELDGVKIEGELKDQLFKAIESGKVEEMQKAQQAIFDYVADNRTNKKSFYRKAVTIRSMSMLSSPLTWLRNIISNMILKPLHKFTDKIGSNIFKSKTDAGQLKLNKQVTPEIQKFITQHFIDNKFFDTFINNLSKYNPSDIKDKQKTTTGLPTKEAIYTNLVLKSMYNQYYNDNMFNKDKKTGQFMNGLYHKLMKVMSDDKYVREAAIRYFGKLLAEHNADISSGQVNDNIMNDLSVAIGLAMNDYMHSNNVFNDIEKAIMERGDGYWFLYKTILPFASSSWNWFKAAMRMTPLGLAKSIVDISRLEKRIAKAKSDWEAGKSQISPELTEFIIRRNLGAGVIGTVAFIFGAILSGLGVMSLEDDDYGVPKLRIGNVVVDVSSIFGTSSVLAGAAFANGIKEEGWGKDGWLTGLNNMVDVWLDDMPIMEIVEMDMYADGGFSMGLKNLGSIALSYIPNFLSYFAGLHKGTIKKDTFWKRAIAKIPFLNWTLETKVDPYTGGEGSWADAIGRIVPFFSLDTASQNEKKSRQLGLNKKELNGTYKINGQDFNVSGKDLQEINKAYGLWNAEDLTKFYDNQLRVKVKVADNKYKELTYNQMTNEQRKNAVQTIMSNNAELAKIMAWTKAGNKYYGSANTYATLKKRGIKTNVYKGTKGFVKSK